MSANRRKTAIVVFVVLFFILVMRTVRADQTCPYGVCAHVSRHGDHELAEEEFKLMGRAGIGWARTDFDWTTVQPSENGPWDFSMLDAAVQKARQANIMILPILGYDVDWARPAYKHLNAWLEYVRKTVRRYHDQLRYWEVWNEEDLESFWKDTPNPDNYTTLLKATYQEIKKINPDLQVVIGGLSGIPYEFIEGIYKAGGAKYFDIMAIHPYRYPETPETQSLKKDLDRLRKLMTQYDDTEKPVWITEIGWPTHQSDNVLTDDIIRCGLKIVDPAHTSWTLAVFDEPGYTVHVNLPDSRLISMLPGNGQIVRLDMAHMKTLSPKIHQALLMPPEEGFAAEVFESIEAYVRDGGIVIFTQGVPLYYIARQTENGDWNRQGADESYRRRLHIGWEAWWTRQGVPKTIEKLTVSDLFRSQIRLSGHIRAERFLTDAALKTGDHFIPLLQASQGDYTGTAAAVFDLNSDLKGAVIVSALMQDYRGESEDRQAVILPRTYLIAFQAGVDCVFWYNFRAFENNPYYNEDNFGIIHKDLSPKPAYRAIQTLTRVRPAGSIRMESEWQTETIFYPAWKRPDGQSAYALWTSGTTRQINITVEGKIIESVDYLGKRIDIQQADNKLTAEISEAPIYLVGPDKIILPNNSDIP